MLEWCFLP